MKMIDSPCRLNLYEQSPCRFNPGIILTPLAVVLARTDMDTDMDT